MLERQSTSSDEFCPRAPGGAGALRSRLKRVAYLQHLLETFGADDDVKPRDAPIWETWLHQSGELPPDFEALPTNALLPDVLTFGGGCRVRTAEEWTQRRDEVLDVLRHYQLGNWPPPPVKMAVEELGEREDASLKGTFKSLRLVFAPTKKAVLTDTRSLGKDASRFLTAQLGVKVFVPDGCGPFPALVEPGDGRWLEGVGYLSRRALGRGYVLCSFDPADAFATKDVYTAYDCNQLVWWAYAASRCIDYLSSLDLVDRNRIGVVGHSRGGKMAVIAAALDERISATIASHTGSGAGTVPPWRYMGEKYGGETLESSTRSYPYWNHPRMRFFIGRENKLPFDSHFLLALAAPRALLVTEGDADQVGETWGAQQAYLAAKEVYQLLGHPERLNIAFTEGGHRLTEKVLDGYIDWLDEQFGHKPRVYGEPLMYTYTFNGWQELTGEGVDLSTFPERDLDDLLFTTSGEPIQTPEAWQEKRKAITKRVAWCLGELPQVPESYAAQLVNITPSAQGWTKADLPIEGMLAAHLTYPTEAPGPLPVVVYLHAYLDARGYDWPRGYGWGSSVGERLAQSGFLAVEYDQFGYGSRNHDCGIEFYAKYPRQSAMGVMVQDVRKVITALQGLSVADGDRIMVAGFSLGGAVALYAASLDERIQAVALACGFASMRLDAHGNETEGIRRYCHLRPTLPRLGFFLGHERQIPYDYHEILGLIAPRPALVLAPTLDQDWRFDDVKACYESAREVYRVLGVEDKLCLQAPADFNRYPPRYQNMVNEWLAGVARELEA